MKLTSIAISAAALVLSACGGGGDSGTPTAQTQTVSGTAATGAAMAGATVTATCSSGSGTATTKTDGTYSVPVSGGSLPCVLTATSSDGKTVLHSVVAGSGSIGSGATANVTPLTELLLARLTGQDPAKYVAAFGPTTTVSADSVKTAQTALSDLLKAAGLVTDTSSISDVIGGAITAGGGQGYDGVLDKLKKMLDASGSTLADLTTTVANTAGSSGTAAGSTLGTVLAASNSACPSLKSGTHRLIKSSDGSEQDVTIDATGLTATVGGKPYTLTAGTTACGYTLNDTGATQVMVAKSGLAVWANGTGSTGTLSISVPKQTIDPSVINGAYNYAGLSGPDRGEYGTQSYTNGVQMAGTNCLISTSCTKDTTTPPFGNLKAASDGGVDWVDANTSSTDTYHAYGFQNAQGSILWVAVHPTSGGTSVGIFVPQTTLTVPAVGATSAYWQTTANEVSGLSAVTEDSSTVTAVSGSTVTRTFASDSTTDQLTYNDPFPGMRHRAANTCTTAAGAASSCGDIWQLPMGGIVFSQRGIVGGTTASTAYKVGVAVGKP